jgi:hypothetical protein
MAVAKTVLAPQLQERLRQRIQAEGLKRTAASLGMNPVTCSKAGVGEEISRLTATLLEQALKSKAA